MNIDPLGSAVLLLGAGVAAMGAARMLKVSPVIGFFVAGALVGPFGTGLVDPSSDALKVLAEFGVCFLLFDAGLHISVSHLKKQWRRFLSLGGAQFIAVSCLRATAGRAYGLSMAASVVIGMTLALSSTALVLKILNDEQEEDSPVGHTATEILVFQDLVGILLLVVLGSYGTSSSEFGSVMLRTAGNIGLCLLIVAIGGKLLLRPFFKWIACINTDEVFTASALLFVLMTCWLTHAFGLSLALGAFLAGVALSESNYSFLVRGEITPFRGLLLSLFFLTVGMSIDLPLLYRDFPAVAGATIAMMAMKTIGLIAGLRLLGIGSGAETRLGFLLAQGSEFAFVILALCSVKGLLAPPEVAFFGAVVSVSMLGTPFFGHAGCFFSRCVARISSEEQEAAESQREVVIVEFDEVGRQLASALIDAGIPYRAHDRDWGRIAYGKSRGFNVHYSDPSRPRTIARASIGAVRAVISLVEDDHILTMLVDGLKKVAPNVPIIAGSSEPRRLEMYYGQGVETAFSKDAGAEVMFEALLEKLQFPATTISELKSRIFREETATFFPRAGVFEEAQAAH